LASFRADDLAATLAALRTAGGELEMMGDDDPYQTDERGIADPESMSRWYIVSQRWRGKLWASRARSPRWIAGSENAPLKGRSACASSGRNDNSVLGNPLPDADGFTRTQS
jgi:hypothetical protein